MEVDIKGFHNLVSSKNPESKAEPEKKRVS